ncbi:MAG TPA: hypothetical protein DCP97_02910 [Ruminococcaceae bacterium]|nr:hypothetical protein [Oscillospiraceae bacterium]
MFKSIKSKVVIIVGSVVFLLVISQLVMNILFARNFYVFKKSMMFNSVFDDLSKSYQTSVDDIKTKLNTYEERYNLRFIIANESFYRLYNTRQPQNFKVVPPTTDIKPQLQKKELDINIENEIQEKLLLKSKDFFNEHPKVIKHNTGYAPGESLALYGIINKNNQKIYVLIETPLAAIQENITTMNEMTVYISVVVLLFGSIAVYFMASKMTEPIKQISAIAKNISKLDFSQKVDYKYDDEIGGLANDINIMSNQLERFITELNEKNRQLTASLQYKDKVDKMRKEFVSNVSHELKTPLALLMGYSEMLKSDIEGIDKSFYYDVIIDESSKMNELVKSLLELSELENNISQLKYENIDLAELAGWIFTKHEILFKNNNINTECQMEQNCIVSADSYKLEQAIKNYLINAINHTAANGKIIISCKNTGNYVLFSVFNEGEPIPENIIDKIWDSFYKVDEARTRTKGNGLGLYIVKTIIKAHGGSCGVQNKENGVEFWFELPAEH